MVVTKVALPYLLNTVAFFNAVFGKKVALSLINENEVEGLRLLTIDLRAFLCSEVGPV